MCELSSLISFLINMLVKAFILTRATSSLRSATPFKKTAYLRAPEQVKKWLKILDKQKYTVYTVEEDVQNLKKTCLEIALAETISAPL